MSAATALSPATAFPAASALGALTAERFERALAESAGAPAWWLERKRGAYERFAVLPAPRRTDESWRFSSLAGLGLPAAPAAPEPGGAASPLAGVHLAASLRFVNNRLAPGGGLPADLAARGVILTTLAEAARHHPDLLKAHFMAQPQRLGSEKFAALHTAFALDGAFLYLPRGVELADPILLVHAASGGEVFPHTLVVAEENTRATVIDYFTGSAPLALGANDLYAGHGSQLTYVAVQDWSPGTLSFQLNSTVVRRDARVQSLNVHLGARQARHESLSQLQAPGAFSEMLAVTVADRAQEFDQRTLQVHQAPNTKSDLLYKNVLLDEAKTIFSGLIIVDPDAQKTDAYQSNRNLVLGDGAEANSLPGLEIQANDVRCTHGATTSRLDPEQEFYLQARGIPPPRARQLLIFAFFEEVLNRLAHEDLHAALRELIQAKIKA
jgi:Fe-S cluster assembly protein SufD